MLESFPMIPASPRAFWWLGVAGCVLAAIGLVLAAQAWSGRHIRFEVEGGSLHIRGTLFPRELALASLDLGSARVLDLTHEPELRPSWRTWGTALPGLQTGWFRLENGGKALLYVSDGLEMIQGEDLFHAVSQKFQATGGTTAFSRMQDFNAQRDFTRLTQLANTSRVSFYTIDAAGLRGGDVSARGLVGILGFHLLHHCFAIGSRHHSGSANSLFSCQ